MVVRSTHALLLLVALGLAAPSGAGGFEAPELELVHVQANTGVAAGGHVALRAGPQTFHWEVREDGWLRLGREPWEPFRLRYGTLENRPLRRVRLELGEAERERLHGALLSLWGAQSRDLARLDALTLARGWAEHAAGAAPPALRGVGFFEARPSETRTAGRAGASRLRATLEERLGAGFVEGERRRVERGLRDGSLDGQEPGALRDALLLREALLAIELERPLRLAARVDPEASLADPRGLDAAERRQLTGFLAELEETVARLLVSPRRDRGQPLLLAIARQRAVAHSLAEGRLWLLDAVSSDAAALDPGESQRHRALVEALAERAASGWRGERERVLSGPLDEPSYNQLEEAATGAAEVHAALGEGRPMRVRPVGRLVPARPGPLTPLSGARVLGVAELGEAEAHARTLLAERYRYDLVRKNCATELAVLLRAGAPSSEPGLLSFVPGRLVADAAASAAGGALRRVPPHRRRAVAAVAEREGRLRVALRESNTLSARVYPGSISDGHFLFFADGTPWLRPAQGTANLVYGLSHAMAGVVAAPFDRGERLLRGLRGAFYSLPEIVGVSIRKGRYDLLPLEDSG